MIYQNITELIGNTPLLRLKNIEEKENINAKIIAKLEYLNPLGSAKDRIGAKMLLDALNEGKISKGATIIEPTSGNTGIAVSGISASLGFKAVIVMPDTMSKERIKMMEIFGAKVVLTDGKKGMQEAVKRAYEINENTPNSIVLGQFENPSNPMAHYITTGREIYDATLGKVDIFVSAIGTGGTISGTGKYLKEKNPNIKIIGIEPDESPLLTKGKSAPHKIQGIGANFVPKCLDTSIYDEIITVTGDESYKYANMLAKSEGVFAGISSGAALCGALKIAKREENKDKNIVVLLPDSGDRYLSSDVF